MKNDKPKIQLKQKFKILSAPKNKKEVFCKEDKSSIVMSAIKEEKVYQHMKESSSELSNDFNPKSTIKPIKSLKYELEIDTKVDYLSYMYLNNNFKILCGYTIQQFNEIYSLLIYAEKYDLDGNWIKAKNPKTDITTKRKGFMTAKEILFVFLSYLKNNCNLNNLYDKLELNYFI